MKYNLYLLTKSYYVENDVSFTEGFKYLMVYFNDMSEAARAVIAIKELPVSAAEMLDKRSLSSVNAGEIEGLTALLIQTQAHSQHDLADKSD